MLLLAISLYSGTPGSYKSYHAVYRSILWLKTGGNVISNFPLNYGKVIKKPVKGIYEMIDNTSLTVDYLINFAAEHHKRTVKAQTLVVIDEASIRFNSRDFNVKDRMEWIRFFANHRPFNFEIVLIAQQDRMLDRQIRGCIETEFKHRALKNHKLFGRFLNWLFHGCFMCVEYWYPCKLKNEAMFHVFNKRIASCYDTMALFIDSNNKMSQARQESEQAQQKTLPPPPSTPNKSKNAVTVSNALLISDKLRIKKNMSTLVNVLSGYIASQEGLKI